MKKIVFVITSLQNYGGTERVATFLANELSKYHDITILSQQVDKSSKTFLLNDRVNDVRLKSGTIHFPLAVKRYIKLHSPDLVVIHTMTKLTPALLLLGVKATKLWSLEHISYLFFPRLLKVLRKILYPRLSKIIVLTELDKLHYLNINQNIEVIHNASPLPITNKPYDLDSKIVVSIGHLDARKGYDLLLQAWKPIEALHPDWKLHIYGEGPELDNLKNYCIDNNLKSVTFMGSTNNPVDAYDSSGIYVMSSRYEGFGLVLIEAQSRGIPTVSFDCPYGPSEIINDGKDGILVPPEDIKHMTEALIELIENDSLRKEYSQSALNNAKKFEKQTIINKWLELIEKEVL